MIFVLLTFIPCLVAALAGDILSKLSGEPPRLVLSLFVGSLLLAAASAAASGEPALMGVLMGVATYPLLSRFLRSVFIKKARK